MDTTAEDIAKEILGKTTYNGIHSKNQFGLLKLLLENLGNYVGNKDIAAKLKEAGILSKEMDSDVARRQVLKAVNIVGQKLQQYASRKDSNPKHCYIVEKEQGGGAVRLVAAYEAMANYSIQPFTAGLPRGLIELTRNRSTSTGRPIDEIVREALEKDTLSDKDFLNRMEERKTNAPMGYVGMSGLYLDGLMPKKPPKKK